jgi:hypothetical protein
MRKTTVYLSDDEADALRSAAAASGKSQSELIREGVRRVTSRRPRRVFHSMGVADSGDPTLAERFDEVYGEELERDFREQMGEA